MKIPKSVTVGKTIYKVVVVQSLHNNRGGEIDYKAKEIRLADNEMYGRGVSGMVSKAFPIPHAEQYANFIHEIVHAILRDMKKHDLNNEAFVNALSGRLTVALSAPA